jgi:hypothetical protein
MSDSHRQGRHSRTLSRFRVGVRDGLATPDGTAIPIWRAGASDPVAHMASVFDSLPGRPRDVLPE